MLQVVHDEVEGKTVSRITAIVSLPKSMTKREKENDAQWFSFEDGTQIPDNIPAWIVEVIRTAYEWMPANTTDTASDDDWPEGLSHVADTSDGVPF